MFFCLEFKCFGEVMFSVLRVSGVCLNLWWFGVLGAEGVWDGALCSMVQGVFTASGDTQRLQNPLDKEYTLKSY